MIKLEKITNLYFVERQHELSRLKQTVKLAREENNSLYKQITELKVRYITC